MDQLHNPFLRKKRVRKITSINGKTGETIPFHGKNVSVRSSYKFVLYYWQLYFILCLPCVFWYHIPNLISYKLFILKFESFVFNRYVTICKTISRFNHAQIFMR